MRFSSLRFLDLDDSFWSRCPVTREDAPMLERVVRLVLGLSATVRKEGLLALEMHIPKIPVPLGRVAFKMLVDGRGPDYLGSACRTLLLLSQDHGAALLAQVMLVHGSLMIYAGTATDYIAETLCAYLGATYVEAAMDGKFP